MRFPKLRIAWSVGWSVAALLLIALWVRSYSYREVIGFPSFAWIDSNHGRITLYDSRGAEQPTAYWYRDSVNGLFIPPGFKIAGLPHLLLVIVAASLTAMPWIRSRFSLRTLFIATALVAVGAGCYRLGVEIGLAHLAHTRPSRHIDTCTASPSPGVSPLQDLERKPSCLPR
jgi:hypothetical protein